VHTQTYTTTYTNICVYTRNPYRTIASRPLNSSKSNKYRNTNFTVQTQVNSKSQFEFVPRDTEKFFFRHQWISGILHFRGKCHTEPSRVDPWWYMYVCMCIYIYIYPYGQKLDPSGVCFGWYVLALSVRKRIFLKTKKADQKQFENWRRESCSEFHKTSPTCERGDWRKQLQDFSLKVWNKPPFAHVPFRGFFGLMVRCAYTHAQICVYTRNSYRAIPSRHLMLCIYVYVYVQVYTAPEASWRRVFDPCTPLLFDLYHYLEQNEYFWLVPEHAPGPGSQVLPGGRIRHPRYSKKLFVRYIRCAYTHTNICVYIRNSYRAIASMGWLRLVGSLKW